MINEVLTNSAPTLDTIELHNTTGASIPVANWYLSDSNSNYRKFRIPGGTIPAGSYVTLDEDDFNADEGNTILGYAGEVAVAPTTVTTTAHGKSTGDVITISGYGGIGGYDGTHEVTVLDNTTFTIPVAFLDNHGSKGTYTSGEPFALSSLGDDVWLLEGDATGRPVAFVDRVEFAAAFPGDTLGRWPDGAGSDRLITMTAATFGSANRGPQIGPVVLSEVMYHPDAAGEDHFEYVEICNTGNETENLANWRLRGGVDFEFTAAHELAPGGLLVVVGFDPATNLAAASALRSAYRINSSIALAGPWTDGPLRNDTGTVRLQRAGDPPPGEPASIPQITEDEVVYFNTAPWPEAADGAGQSLTRTGLDQFGNFPTSWTAAGSTPGSKEPGESYDYATYRDLTFGPGMPPGSGEFEDFDSDGLLNILEAALRLDPLVADAFLMPQPVVEKGQLTLTYSRDILLSGI
ncbi:MAG: lamin tail domain-containing protein, partial [Akkermansiaceae bacterium]|nr:lamin tail domain-containing protein [Akkermansiaceae bacterium]